MVKGSIMSPFNISISGHLMSTPYLTSPDLVQCEVTLPGTPYKEIIYKQFQIEQTNNNNNNSVTMASDCQLRHRVTVITVWIVISIHVHVYSCFSKLL